jgi:hypothetical protein
LKFSGAGVGAKGFRTARAEPVPAIDFLQTLTSSMISSSEAVHWSRPLVETFSVLGNVIVIVSAVVLLSTLF